MVIFWRRLMVGALLFGGALVGHAQALDRYGWVFEIPFSFFQNAVTGPDGSVYLGGVEDDVRIRGGNYRSTTGVDVVVIKILPSGALDWVERFGGKGDDQFGFLSIDESGRLIVSGNEVGVGDRRWVVDAAGQTVSMLDGAGNALRVSFVSGGGFVEPTFFNSFQVLDGQGKFLWGRKTHSMNVRAVRQLADKTFLAVGEVKQFDRGRIGKNGRIPDGDEEWVDIQGPIIARFGVDGELLWAKSAVDPVQVFSSNLTAFIDGDGNAFLGGTFSNALELGNHRLETGGGEDSFLRNAFIVSWDRDGNVRWIKHLPSDSGSNVKSIALSSNGTAYIAGEFDDAVAFEGQSFVEDPIDEFRWTGAYVVAVGAGGASSGFNALSVSEPALIPAPSGELFLRGLFEGERQFGAWNVGAAGQRNVAFVARLGNLEPTIAEHPESQSIDDTTQPIFDVLVTGSEPFELQWRKDGVALEESDLYRGVNESTLRVFQVGRENAGSYDVVASSGAASATSRPAIVSFNNAPPVFTSGTRVTLDLNQVDEEVLHRLPLAVEDPDGDQSFTWELNGNSRFRGEPLEVSLASATGSNNELIVRWPAPEGRRFQRLNYQGTVVLSDPGGASAELFVQVFSDPPVQTRLLSGSNIVAEEDSSEVVINRFVSDSDIHPKYVNSETLEWRVAVQPETLGVATVTPANRGDTEQDLAISFTSAPDAAGEGEVILEAIGSQTPGPASFSIPVSVLPVNDAPRLLSEVRILGDSSVGTLVRGHIGEWVDPETDVLALTFELQWVVNNRPDADGAQELPGANTDALLLGNSLLDRYIALRVSVTDERLPGHRGQVETIIAYSDFRQVGIDAMSIPDFSQLSQTPISGGYRMRARPDAFGNDWILERKRMINLRDPELSFDINDRVRPPFLSNDPSREWSWISAFKNNPNWIGMVGTSIQNWVFDVRRVLESSQRVLDSEALFTYFTGRGSDRFTNDYLGHFVTPEGQFFRLSESNVTNRDVLYLDASDGTRVSTLTDGRVSDLPAIRAQLRANPNVSHVLFIQRTGELSVRDFPGFELVSEISLATNLSMDRTSSEWGLSEDGTRALVQTEGLAGQKQILLVDLQSGTVVREFRLKPDNDFIVSLPIVGPDQTLARGPLTVTVNEESSFVIERDVEVEGVALLDFVSWSSGEVLRTDWIEKGTFRSGDYYHPDRPGQFLYASEVTSSLLVYDIVSGETVERLSVPEQLLSDGGDLFTDVRTSVDGRLIFLSNRSGHTVAFHPLASGEVRGVVFEDRNGNGQLDFGLIQSETPHIVYVVDVSGSVEEQFVGTAVGDVNFDERSNTILDAELAAFMSFHRNLIRFGQADDAQVAVVGFSGEARAFGLEGVVEPAASMMEGRGDTDGDLIPDVLQALRRVRLSTEGLGGGTDFFSGLAMARDIFGAAGTAPEQANIIFLSDGEASNNFQELADELKGLGVNIRAIGVGRDSSLRTLQRIDSDAIQVASSDELIAAFEPEEDLLPDVRVYADFDESGDLSDDEANTSTLSDNAFTSLIEAGDYSFRPIRSGSYPIRAAIPEFEVTSNPVAQVQPVVPTIHLIAMRSIHQVDPPSIAIQPAGGEWEIGQTVRLSVFAVGSGLRFQWLKNGSAIVGETNSSLTIENLQMANGGEYSVRIANDGGTVESVVATVVARMPARVIPLGEAMDMSQFTWRTGGSAEWRGTVAESFVNGSSAGVSGVNDGEEAWFETDVVGPGTVEFYWKVSSDAGEDFLRFERSGGGSRSSTQISGDTDWTKSGKIELTGGLNTLRWIYRKNDANAAGQDAAWVDALVFEAGAGVPPSVSFLPQQFVNVGEDIELTGRVEGTLPMTFQWQFNGVDIPEANRRRWFVQQAGVDDSGEYRLVASNDFGSVTSNSARIVVRDETVSPPIVESTEDLWDVSQGVIITEHSPLERGVGWDIRDVFGGMFGTHSFSHVAGSVTFENAPRGTQHTLYWETPEPVTIGRVRLFAEGDGPENNNNREFLSMVVRAKEEGSETFNRALANISPSHPYEFLDERLILDFELPTPVTAREFMVFFTQDRFGPRIYELDAFAPAIDAVQFLSHPQDAEVMAGQNVTFSVTATGTEPLVYQWSRNGVDLVGEMGSELSLTSVDVPDSGQYRVTVSNAAGSVSSEVANLNVLPAVAPISIVVHPRDAEVAAGESLGLFVVASGGEPFSYQWRRNRMEISGATRDQLLLQSVNVEDTGEYDVVVTNPSGQIVSQAASVVVTPASVPPPVTPPVPGGGPIENYFDFASMGIVFNQDRDTQGMFNPGRPGAIAVDGEWALIGDPQGGTLLCDDCGSRGRGQVIVFRRIGNEWVRTQTLEEPLDPSLGPMAYQDFGDRFELAQGTLVVGTNGGAYYSYRLSGDQWVLGQSYIDKVGATSGIAMDQAGRRLVVGPDPSGSLPGPDGLSTFLGFSPSYQRSSFNDDWVFASYLIKHSSSDPDPTFVAFGNTGFVGDDDMEMSPSGNFLAASREPGVAFFTAPAPGRWQFVERLDTPDEGSGTFPDRSFGRNLALSDSHLAVGAPSLNQSVRGERQGAVFVYRIDSGRPQLIQTLKQPDLPGLPALRSIGTFGNSVAMNERFIVVGNWTGLAGLPGTTAASNTGLVYIYERTENQWEFREGVTASQVLAAITPRFIDEVDDPDYFNISNLSTHLDIHGNQLIISGKLRLGLNRSRKMGFIFPLPGSDIPTLPPAVIPPPSLRWDRSSGALVVDGVAGASYLVEATSDPSSHSWVPVTTLTLETSEGAWADPVSSSIPFRFYRARLAP